MPPHKLTRTPKSGPPPPLPEGITRTWLDTPDGKLELLVSLPAEEGGSNSKPPILFLHGGFGSGMSTFSFIHLPPHIITRKLEALSSPD